MSKQKYPRARMGAKTGASLYPAVRLMLTHRPGNNSHTLNFDGGCIGNGSPDAVGAWAYTVRNHQTARTDKGSGTATGSLVTCNVAEWDGLVAALKSLIGTGVGLLVVRGDSRLVINQLNGQWSARGQLAERLGAALLLLERVNAPWYAYWVPRERNVDCDALCASAMPRYRNSPLSGVAPHRFPDAYRDWDAACDRRLRDPKA